MIPQFMPVFDESDAKAVYDVVKAGYLNERSLTRELERRFAEYVGSRYALATSSGTAALFLALKACGVRHGDKVAVPDLTMIGTANAVRLAGGVPVLADVRKEDGNIDSDRIRRKGLKMAVLVHLNGRPADVRLDIPYVEDAAQCLGSFLEHKHLGTFGRVGCFSLATTKIITSGGGGMAVTDDRNLYWTMKALKDQGREDRRKDGSFAGPQEFYPYEGYNFRLDEMRAALGLSQFAKLPERVEHKRRVFRLYRELLGDSVEYLQDREESLLWYFDLLSSSRGKIAQSLKANGIGSRDFYRPLHHQPQYWSERVYRVSNLLWHRGMYLPSSSNLTDEEVRLITSIVKEAVV